ncbi:hypothetical protein [Accumulibacter sp.]|uniref:hypothetical protein n=1 Tax=Accumulibacter sp. TaxID=2053492 RepID=UPI0025E8F74B|nr:hypothetical protein [Accumulibacter sp.]MCP5230259.1 hypothetical protein [Accumulibacter sp.]
MSLVVQCHTRVPLGPGAGLSRQLDVLRDGVPAVEFEAVCEALDCDVQSATGGGGALLALTKQVLVGGAEHAEVDGNGWIIRVDNRVVKCSGLYGQGGGEIDTPLFHALLEEYVAFLSDPQKRPRALPLVSARP